MVYFFKRAGIDRHDKDRQSALFLGVTLIALLGDIGAVLLHNSAVTIGQGSPIGAGFIVLVGLFFYASYSTVGPFVVYRRMCVDPFTLFGATLGSLIVVHVATGVFLYVTA